MNKRIVLYVAVFAFLAFSFIYSLDAEAVSGQKYFGDGATPDAAGGWSYTSAIDSSCFVCHQPNPLFVPAPDKTSYLMTGHRNVLRKATVSSFWSGPDGLPYDTDSSGRAIFWNSPGPISLGTSTQHPPLLDGSCSLWGYLNQSACQSAGGTWTSASNSLFYIIGGWMNTITGTAAYNDPGTSIAAPGSVTDGSSYPCARCHTTGVTLSTTVSTTRPPDRTYPGINSYVNFDPDGNGPATTVSWATGFSSPFQTLEGVQCERCHNATNHFTGGPTVPRGANATALCLECHRQEHTVTYTSGGIGANINPTPFADNSGLPASEPTYTLPAIEVGRSDGSYAQAFFGYSTGMEFLNSVHGRFTGNYQQINDPTKYASGFSYGSCDLNGYSAFSDQPSCEFAGGSWTSSIGCSFNQANCEANAGTWTELQGGCTTCHDVHNSMFVDSQAAQAIKVQCADCHTGQTPGAGVPPQITISDIFHPTTAGTPFDTSRYGNACVVCHMATQAVANGDQISTPAHLWRINTSAMYTTWPTADQFNGTNGETLDKRATMSAETYTMLDGVSQATYTNAVWLDVDLACGQCHGGSVTEAPPLTKVQLAGVAKVMHGGTSADIDCTICHTKALNHPTGNGTPGSPSNAASCKTCHLAAGNVPLHTRQDQNIQAVCGQCHGGSSTTTHNGAPYKTSAQLDAQAVWIHAVESAPPVPGVTAVPAVNTAISPYTVTFTDNSSAGSSIKVNWGDGNVVIGNQGNTFTHTYASRTRTYSIVHTATNAEGSSSGEVFQVPVPVKFTVSGSAVAGARLYLKKSGHTLKIVTAAPDGSFSFSNVVPGDYTITAYKSGSSFSNPAATVPVTNADVTGITISEL
jgi:hypothetical protein